MDGLEDEAVPGHHPGLEAPVGAHEDHVVQGVAAHHLLRERDAREEVASGAAAGDQDPHAGTSLPASEAARGRGARARTRAPSEEALIDSSTPAAPISTTSELPP